MALNDNKIKIYLISNMYPSAGDAYFGVFVKNFCAGIENDEHISIIAKSVIRGQGKTFVQKLKKYINFYLSILYHSFFKDFDIIYVHNVSHTLIPLYPVLLRKIFKKFIIILNPHGEDMIITHKLDGILLNLSLPFIRTADQIVLPSNYFRDKITDLYQLDPKKMFVSASGGINLDTFRPLDLAVSSPDGSKRLGYVSRIDADKGWDTLLYAISKIVHQKGFNELKVTFVGKGESIPDFLNLVNTLKINDHVEYLGFKSHLELPQIFNALDAFIFPTRMYESLGLVGLEAMACKIPVIGSDRGGLTDYIKDGYNGYLFECNNADSLVTSIMTFYTLGNTELLQMKENALQTARIFSQKSVSDAMIVNLTEIKKTKQSSKN